MASESGIPGPIVAYGAPIRDAITRGNLSEMRAMLETGKAEITRLEDLKSAVSDLEKSITATEATRGVSGTGASGINLSNGLYIVDLRSLGLTPDRQLAIEKAIQSAVLSAIADIPSAGGATRGVDGGFGRPGTMGISIRDL